MEFIRRVGGQAEVNDGGKIRRLPFSGDGVPPQPGAKVNPVRDACCCPDAVPLEPNRVNHEALRSDPRRDKVTKNKERGFNLVVPYQFLTNQVYYLEGEYPPHINPLDYGKFGWVFPLSSLMGSDIKVLIWPGHPTAVLPLPEAWLQWNLKNNSFKLVKIKPSSTIYYFALYTFGADYYNLYLEPGKPPERFPYEYVKEEELRLNTTGIDWGVDILTKGTKGLNKEEIDSLYRPIDPRGFKIKVFQPFRDKRPVDDFRNSEGYGYMREFHHNLGDPESFTLRAFKENFPDFKFWYSTDYVKPLLSKKELINIPSTNIDGSIYDDVAGGFGYHYHLRPESIVTPKLFMKWYKNPESFKYERIP